MTLQASTLLAICLPTYERQDLLARCLEELVTVVRPYGIPIYVSDNCSTDGTADVVKRFAQSYSLLHYSRPEENLPVDDHFRRVLSLPNTEYRWLFGDHYRIASTSGLERLLSQLDGRPDFAVLNGEHRIKGISSQSYIDQNRLLGELGWHMTMMSALVYSARALAQLNFDRYKNTNLLQTLTIFEYLDGKPFEVAWVSDEIVGGFYVNPVNGWHDQALEIFARRWFTGIMSLPPGYRYDVKLQAIRSHAANVYLFSPKGALYLRSIGALSFGRLHRHRRELPFVFGRKQISYLWLIAMIPLALLRSLRAARRSMRAWIQTWVAAA